MHAQVDAAALWTQKVRDDLVVNLHNASMQCVDGCARVVFGE